MADDPVTFRYAVLIPAVKVLVAEPDTVRTVPTESAPVVVALVVVAFAAVRLPTVVEPVEYRLAVVMRPVDVTLPVFRVVEKRLVLEAVVAKILVEVALVVVEFVAVKFCNVEEPVTRRLVVVTRPVEVKFPVCAVVAKSDVELAVGDVRIVPSNVKPAFPVRVSASDQYVTRVAAPDPSMVELVRHVPFTA